MLKKILLGFLIIVSGIAIGSCNYTDSHSEIINNISDAFSKRNPELAAQLCDRLYNNINNCSVETLANLTMNYYTLSTISSTNNDETGTYDSMERMVNCYISAMKKDPAAAKNCWNKIAEERLSHGEEFNISRIPDSFCTQLNLHNTIDD